MLTDRNNVSQTYSGKLGCMCGCRGTHHAADTIASSRIYNKVMKDPTRQINEEVGCVSVETDTRINVVFFKK